MKTDDEIKEVILLRHCISWYVTNNTTKKKIFNAMQEWAEEYHRQHNVNMLDNGNEANQSAIKKDGEVAICDYCLSADSKLYHTICDECYKEKE